MRDLTDKDPKYQDGYRDCLSDFRAELKILQIREQRLTLEDQRATFNARIHKVWAWLTISALTGAILYDPVYYLDRTIASVYWVAWGLVVIAIGWRTWGRQQRFELWYFGKRADLSSALAKAGVSAKLIAASNG